MRSSFTTMTWSSDPFAVSRHLHRNLNHSPCPTSNLLLRHPLLRLLLILRPPPRQRRPTIHDIADAPQHSLLIQLLRDIVVRTQDVELVVAHLLVQEFRDLRWGPCTIWLLLVGARRVANLGSPVSKRLWVGWIARLLDR